MLPLYEMYDEPKKKPEGHKGLWFERFFSGYDAQYQVGEEEKQKWINTITGGTCGLHKNLQDYAVSQNFLCHALNGQTQIFKTDWHFVTGMGNNHPVENGMSWHPTLGTPYLSGASVKGLIRSWIEEWSDLTKDEIYEKSLKWFGSDNKAPEEQGSENQAGCFIFFDALPIDAVQLTCDIMTPHMGKWYSDGAEISKGEYAQTLPADWHDPVPIAFLVIKEGSFYFSIAPRTAQVTKEELAEVFEVLKMALEYLGAGAKTATGYGRFIEDTNKSEKMLKTVADAARKRMKPEDAFLDQLSTIENKKLAEMFGKSYNKTKKEFEENQCDWDKILQILFKNKKELIRGWDKAGRNTAEGKAYNKLKALFENKK